MNMTTKREVRITDKHFSLENDILTLNINIGDYDITGKQITAVFEPKGIETVPLTAETAEGVTTVSLPIYSSYIAEGVNYIQLYFRWDTTKLEQSGKMMWVVERSLVADNPGVKQQDLMSYYLQQMVLAIAEADRVVDEAGDVRVELDGSTASATAINNTLADPATGTIKLATDANATLSQSIIDAGIADGALTDPVTGAIVLAEAAEDALTNPITGAIKLAEDAKGDIEQAIIDNEIVTQTEFIAHKEDYATQVGIIENKLKFPLAYVIQNNAITLNYQTNLISFISTFHMMNGKTLIPCISKPSINISSLNYSGVICVLYFDLIETTFKACHYSLLPDVEKLIVCYFFGESVATNNRNALKIIRANATEVEVALTATTATSTISAIKSNHQLGWVYNDNAITIDLESKKIKFNVAFLLYGGTFKSGLATADFDLTTINYTTGTIVCYFDAVSQTIKVSTLAAKPVLDSYILFTYYGGGDNLPSSYTLITHIPRSVHIKNIDGTTRNEVRTSDVATNVVNGVEPPYEETKQRLLLPPKMFFIDGIPLPIYKNNLFAENSKSLNMLKTALINIDSNSNPKYQYFNEDILLNPADLQNTFTIGVKQYTNPDYNYYGDIIKSSVVASSNEGKTPNVINMGDSLTSRNIPQRLRDKLASFGVNASMQGTMDNGGGVKGEGREGWKYENFIGSDNTFGVTPITRQTTSGVGSLTTNPFLKLADGNDIANNPTWCFRNTGSNQELSYATDPIKTGNFYIFDFAYYLTTQGFTTPDVVTIALSTNDITQDTVDALAQCRLGLEIMIKQIKSACPVCKIGVVPSPAWGSNSMGNTRWATYASVWIENCMTDILALQGSVIGLSIVPIWCHINRDFSFPYDTNNALSSINQTRKAHRTEHIHWSDIGKVEYVNALNAYIMNVI